MFFVSHIYNHSAKKKIETTLHNISFLRNWSGEIQSARHSFLLLENDELFKIAGTIAHFTSGGIDK